MVRKQRQAAGARQVRRRAARMEQELELLQAKMRRHILGQPFEILSMIARRVLLSSEAVRDTLSLCHFIQTCKKFREVGLPVLYRQLDGSNVRRGGWWQESETWSNPPDPAERICRSILSIVQNSRGDLIRFADFHALTGLDLLNNANTINLLWASVQDSQLSAAIRELLALLGVNMNPSHRSSRHLAGGREGYRWFDVQTVMILLGLLVMPKLVKLRLPINSTSLELGEIPSQPGGDPVHVRASWGTPTYHLEFHRKNLPSFSELRELDLVYGDHGWEEYQDQNLDVDKFSWIVQAATRLQTLRLDNFYEFRGRNGLEFHLSLPSCDNITTLSLTECGITFEKCQQLLSCFPQLERFKMTRSRPDPYSDRDDVGYLERERASLMLRAISAAAPGLKKIFLGECIRPTLRRENWPEKDIPLLPTNGLSGLKTLGLTHDNLFEPDDSMENADILVNIVRGCPTLETLEIFDALHVWNSGRPAALTLGDALQALAKDLDAWNKTSHLKEIRLWYFDQVYFMRHLGVGDSWFYHRREESAAEEKPSPLLAPDGSGDILLPISDYSGRWADRDQRLRERENSGLIEVFRSLGIRLTLQLEKGMTRRGFMSTEVEDTPFPQFRGVDPDETLWH